MGDCIKQMFRLEQQDSLLILHEANANISINIKKVRGKYENKRNGHLYRSILLLN